MSEPLSCDYCAITVVIPTYNSARTLRACLASIVAQASTRDEVIVVDDTLTSDTTRDICGDYKVRLIVSSAKMAESRNVGLRAAIGEVVIHIDSDMQLVPGALERIRDAMTDRAVDALILSERSVGVGYWARARAIDKAAADNSQVGVAARVCRKSVALRLGGHSNGLEAGEDADFHRKLVTSGAVIRYLPDVTLLHDEGRLTLRAATIKKYRYGLTLPVFERQNGHLYSWGEVIRRLGSGCAVSIRRDPFALPGYLLLRLAELTAGLVGRSVGSRRRQAV